MMIFELLAVIVLVLANGFFVAAEFSLVAIRRSRVEQLVAERHADAQVLQEAVQNLDMYLAATQLGITMSSLGLGWIGEPVLATLIEPFFHFLPDQWAWVSAHSLAIVIAFALITTLHIVLGELAPKSLALQQTEKTALKVVRPLRWYLLLFRPAIYALNGLGNSLLKLLRLQPSGAHEMVHSLEELKLLVKASQESGLLTQVEQDLVQRVFHFTDREVRELMTPSTEILWLDLEAPLETNKQEIAGSAHSRFPVAVGTLDNAIGIVRSKDLLNQLLSNQPLDLRAALRKPTFIPENMPASRALQVFKKSRRHVALVVDEYANVQGLITLNDVLESIVGDISSLDEPAGPQAIQREDGSWLIDGMMPVEEFKRILGLDQLPDEERDYYQTLGGFVVTYLNEIPEAGDRFDWEGLRFEVVDMDGLRVDKVLVSSHQAGA